MHACMVFWTHQALKGYYVIQSNLSLINVYFFSRPTDFSSGIYVSLL